MLLHCHSAERLLLGSVGAKIVGGKRAPEIYELLERLAALAEIRLPRLALADVGVANAFAVGLTEKRSIVVITSALRERLDREELERCLATSLRTSPIAMPS